MILFHDRVFVEALHAEQIRLHGGGTGLRDAKLLESALDRPMQKHNYGVTDVFVLASAYLFGISNNHPFIDGNKRTAWAAADIFLYLNGQSVEADQYDVINLVYGVVAGDIDEAGAAMFFQDLSIPA